MELGATLPGQLLDEPTISTSNEFRPEVVRPVPAADLSRSLSPREATSPTARQYSPHQKVTVDAWSTHEASSIAESKNPAPTSSCLPTSEPMQPGPDVEISQPKLPLGQGIPSGVAPPRGPRPNRPNSVRAWLHKQREPSTLGEASAFSPPQTPPLPAVAAPTQEDCTPMRLPLSSVKQQNVHWKLDESHAANQTPQQEQHPQRKPPDPQTWMQLVMKAMQGDAKASSSSGSSVSPASSESDFSASDSESDSSSVGTASQLLASAAFGSQNKRPDIPRLPLAAIPTIGTDVGPTRTRGERSSARPTGDNFPQASGQRRPSSKQVHEHHQRSIKAKVATKRPKQDTLVEAYSASNTTDDDLTNMALYLGIDPKAELHLLWIAEEAMQAPLPDGWHVQQMRVVLPASSSLSNSSMGNKHTQYYWHSSDPKATQWEHPLDEFYRSLVRDSRAAFAEKGPSGAVDDESDGSRSLSKSEDEQDDAEESPTSPLTSAGIMLQGFVGNALGLLQSFGSSQLNLLTPRSSAAVNPVPPILAQTHVDGESQDVQDPSNTANASDETKQSVTVQAVVPPSSARMQEIVEAIEAEASSDRLQAAYFQGLGEHPRPWGINLAIQQSYKLGIAVSYSQQKYRIVHEKPNTTSCAAATGADDSNSKLCCVAAALLPPTLQDYEEAARYMGGSLYAVFVLGSAWVCKAMLFARPPQNCTILDEDDCFGEWSSRRLYQLADNNFCVSTRHPPFPGDVTMVYAHSHKTTSSHPLDPVWKSLAEIPWVSCTISLEESETESVDTASDGHDSAAASFLRASDEGRLLAFDLADPHELTIKQLCNSTNTLFQVQLVFGEHLDVDAAGGVAEFKPAANSNQTQVRWPRGAERIVVPAPQSEHAAIALNSGIKTACQKFTDATLEEMRTNATSFSVRRSNTQHTEGNSAPRYTSATTRPLQLFSRESLLMMTEDELITCLGAISAMLDRQEQDVQTAMRETAEIAQQIQRKEEVIANVIGSASGGS